MIGKKFGALIAVLFSLAFVTAGIKFAVDAAIATNGAWKSEAWPSVQGEITESSYERTTGKTRATISTVRYKYAVEGVEYRASRVAFIAFPWRKPDAYQYEKGQQVTVHFDRNDPGNAVLTPGASLPGMIAEFLTAALFVFVGSLGLAVIFRLRALILR